jgi:ribosomal subunit interface protein
MSLAAPSSSALIVGEKNFIQPARLSRQFWPGISSTKDMSETPPTGLQADGFRTSFSSRAMNRFPCMENAPTANIAASIIGASSKENIRSGRRLIFPLVNTTTNEGPMNRHTPQNELIVSGIHLDLTPSLKTFVQEKTQRLFRHEERISRIRVELECDPKQSVAKRFSAKGHITITGPTLNAVVASDECHKAVSLLIDKLDRMLHRRAKLYKARRYSSTTRAEKHLVQT